MDTGLIVVSITNALGGADHQAIRTLVHPTPVITVHMSKGEEAPPPEDRKSTRLNSSHGYISYAVFCLKKKKKNKENPQLDCRTASIRYRTPTTTSATRHN